MSTSRPFSGRTQRDARASPQARANAVRICPNTQQTGNYGKEMSARELRNIEASYGFEVALNSTRKGRRPIVYNKAADTTPPPPQTPQTVKKKTKRRPNPYAGPSGKFSRKARWSKAKKTRKLDLEEVKTAEEESASDASLALGDPLAGC